MYQILLQSLQGHTQYLQPKLSHKASKIKIVAFANSKDSDDVAHNEPPYQDLLCLPSGPSCSKLTTLLVNILLKFRTLISQIGQHFLLKNCEKLLHCKSFSHFFSKKYQCILL